MKFHLMCLCGEGYNQGKSMQLGFESETIDKAEQFALGVCQLKTFNTQPFKVIKARLYKKKNRILPMWEIIWEWHG